MKKLFLIGLPGAGKSFWSNKLSKESKLFTIDLDGEIVSKANKSIAEIFQEEGETAFRALEHELLKQLTGKHSEFIMACGGGTPCFLDNLNFMKAAGQVIYLRASIPYIIEHLTLQQELHKRPLFQQSQASTLEKITSLLSDRKVVYEKADHIIDIDRLNNDQVLERLKQITQA